MGDTSKVLKKTTLFSLPLSLRRACWETMMWFWKSSSVSGICTVVDTRLWIQRRQRISDKAAENAVRVRSPRTPCPPADPDVPTRPGCSDLSPRWGFDGRTQPWTWAFYTQHDLPLRQRWGHKEEKKSTFPPEPRRCCLSAGTWRPLCWPRDQVCVSWYKCVQVGTHSQRKKEKASSLLVVQAQSHKSVTVQFLRHLHQHRLDLL